MINLRRIFTLPVMGSLLALPFSVYKLLQTSSSFESVLKNPWLGAALSSVPITIVLGRVMTGNNWTKQQVVQPVAAFAVAGPVLSWFSSNEKTDTAVILSICCGVLFLLYDLWYTKLPENEGVKSGILKAGKMLPSFSLPNEKGDLIRSTELVSTSDFTLFMFLRGSWCPLCTAQVRQMAQRYHKLKELGMQVVVVMAEKPHQLKVLAGKFDVPFNFLCDPKTEVSRQLGCLHEDGMPMPIRFEADTILPTTVIVDKTGMIKHVTTTIDYRVRVDPDELLLAAKQSK